MDKPKIELAEVSAEEMAELNGGTSPTIDGIPLVDEPVVETVPAVIDDLAEVEVPAPTEEEALLAAEASLLEQELEEEEAAPPTPAPEPVEARDWRLSMLYDDLLILQADADEFVSQSTKLVAPDTSKDLLRPLEGMVIAVGQGYPLDSRGKPWKKPRFRPLVVQPGDRVHFGRHAITEVTINGQVYAVIKEAAVLAFFRDFGPVEVDPELVEEAKAVLDAALPLPPADPNPLEQ